MFLSAVSWSFSGVISKNVEWNGFSKAGVRAIVAVLIYALARKTFKVKLTAHNLIGALGVATTSLLYMIAVTLTTSANAIVLQYSMPIYVVLISLMVFKIKPSLKDIIVLPILLLGVILCCAGGSSGGEPLPNAALGNALALISGLTFAFVFITSRFKDADSVEYTYLGNLISVLLAVSVFFDKNADFGFDAHTLSQWGLVALLGVSLGLGYLFLGWGLKTASPTTAAILENLEPVLNPIWVFLVVGERPGLTGLIGCAVVLVTVTVYSCLPESKKKDNEGQ